MDRLLYNIAFLKWVDVTTYTIVERFTGIQGDGHVIVLDPDTGENIQLLTWNTFPEGTSKFTQLTADIVAQRVAEAADERAERLLEGF